MDYFVIFEHLRYIRDDKSGKTHILFDMICKFLESKYTLLDFKEIPSYISISILRTLRPVKNFSMQMLMNLNCSPPKPYVSMSSYVHLFACLVLI